MSSARSSRDLDSSGLPGPDHAVRGLAGAAAVPGTLTGAGQADRIVNGYTTWNLFELLGVRPLVGRTFRSDDAITIHPGVSRTPILICHRAR